LDTVGLDEEMIVRYVKYKKREKKRKKGNNQSEWGQPFAFSDGKDLVIPSRGFESRTGKIRGFSRSNN
jgi:hypothetical protein